MPEPHLYHKTFRDHLRRQLAPREPHADAGLRVSTAIELLDLCDALDARRLKLEGEQPAPEPEPEPGSQPAALVALARIGAKILSQDNRITAHPIFIVEERERIYGLDTDWGGDVVWRDDHPDYGEVEPMLAAHLEAGHEKGLEEPPGYQRVGYTDRWKFVTACLTEDAADDFIKRQRHNLREPRVFAASGQHNEEWISLRQALGEMAKARGWVTGPQAAEDAAHGT